MIGAELLNLMYGNPYSQLASAMNPAPQPAPNAPPVQRTGYMQPAPGQVGPAPPLRTPEVAPGQRFPLGAPASGPQVTPATPAEQRGAQVSPGAPQMAPGGPPPNAPPQPPPGQQGLPPTAATQSPPDLASLYLQMEQRNRSANEIDHGLNLMAAAFSTPSMANAIMGSQRQGADPGAQLGNLIMLQNLQRMQSAPPPQGVDASVWNMLPLDQRAKMMSDAAAGQITAQTKLREDVNQGRYEAGAALPDLTTKMTDMDNRINIIKSTPDDSGQGTALQAILSNDAKKRAVSNMLSTDDSKEGWMGTWLTQHQQEWANLTPAEQAVAMQMKQTGGQVYGEAFGSLGNKSRRSTAEVSGIKAGLSQINDLTQPYMSPDGKSGYLPALNALQDQIHKGMANAYGAAGNLDAIPENLRWDQNGQPLVDQSYRPGGQFAGQGGDWLNHPPQKQGGAGAGKTYTYNPKTGQLE